MTVGDVISTHTLRGERDWRECRHKRKMFEFQLTRSVGSVTFLSNPTLQLLLCISTHTLRGERDPLSKCTFAPLVISTHTLRGERDVGY